MRAKAVVMSIALALAVQSGCTRTDDGSVTVADPLHVGRYLQREPAPPATPPVQSGLQVFPIASAAQSASPLRSTRRAGQRRAPATAETPLACRDAVNAGGRVHVVCD